MLQEILLALSGVPSPIWERLKITSNDNEGIQNFVSPPERAILSTLSQLSTLHIEVQDHAAAISSKHASLVCRAVGSAVASDHLGAFRKKVIEVEASILKGDSAYVGGYQIVPLSTIVTDFAPWTRRLEWLRKVTQYIKGTKSSKQTLSCTAAMILEFLENESHTGYTDIARLATQLLIVAQNAWIKSVSTWILYGQLPAFGQEDFMVKQSAGGEKFELCILERSLVPKLVSNSAAESILAVGNALRQIQEPAILEHSKIPQRTLFSLSKLHLSKIKLLQYPLDSSIFESTMLNINESISRHALSSILPKTKILEIFQVFRDYMLLGRGEFAVTLIQNADARVLARQKSHSSLKPVRKLGRIDDMAFKNTELDAILNKTWSDIASVQSQSGLDDEVLDTAQKYLRLVTVQHAQNQGPLAFLSTLLPSPASLQFNLMASSPLTMLLSTTTTIQYSNICNFLLSIRRSQLRLTDLWKISLHRRCHPTPLAPPLSATEFGRRACAQRRSRESHRALIMRRFWSSMNKSLFLLNELSAYLHGEVIESSWHQFRTWLNVRETNVDTEQTSFSSSKDRLLELDKLLSEGSTVESVGRDDPRTLAQGHTMFLDALVSALLVDKEQLVITLQALIKLFDHFVALFARLGSVWEGLDLQEDDGVLDAFTNLAQDEKDILEEMARARDEIEELLEKFVKSLREIDRAGARDDISGTSTGVGSSQSLGRTFVPWKARTLDRLIMKLGFLFGDDERPEDLVNEDGYDP